MNDSLLTSITARLSWVNSQIKALRPAATLIAVSKQQPVIALEEALAAGQRVFGENRVQEAKAKWPLLKAQFQGVELHLIGPLQTNKLHDALKLFDVIETLDRPKLAQALHSAREKYGHCPSCYVQVNSGEEPQKAGVSPSEADDFIGYCKEELALPVTGVMCIPPVEEDPLPHFRLLRTLAERHHLPCCSMGMSHDYACALAVGATHIRVGQAIFGARH